MLVGIEADADLRHLSAVGQIRLGIAAGIDLLFSTLIAVNGRKSLKINKVTLCIWIFGWRKLSLHHVRTQETPQIRCL